MSLNKIKNIVKKILIEIPTTKDNDLLLVTEVWKQQLSEYKLKNISVEDFLNQYKNGNLFSSDTITRIRRKLQEKIPELRGKTFNDRQKKKTVKVKKQIKILIRPNEKIPIKEQKITTKNQLELF